MRYHTRSQNANTENNIEDHNVLTDVDNNNVNNNIDNNDIDNNDIDNNNINCKDVLTKSLSMFGFICFTFCYYINKAFIYVWKIGGIYIVWCSLHYITAQLYAYYCTPYTLLGFITAPFMVATPQCTGLRWCITHGAQTIISMWLVIGSWFMQKLGGYSLGD